MPGEVWALRLKAMPDSVPGPVRMRRALKTLLRSFGLKCVEIAEVNDGKV